MRSSVRELRNFFYQKVFEMASSLKNLSTYNESDIPNAAEMKIGVVVADWHADITHSLYNGCRDTLIKHGLTEENLHVVQVPGAFELSAAARILCGRLSLDAVICLGCVIQGETKHNEYINNAVANGLTNLSIATGVPAIYGVLTPNTEEQAKDRSGGKHGNKGIEAAVTAIRMASLKQEYTKSAQRIGF